MTDYIKGLVEQLNQIGSHDGVEAHLTADDILLAALKLLDGQDIIDAYVALRKRCGGFWYA